MTYFWLGLLGFIILAIAICAWGICRASAQAEERITEMLDQNTMQHHIEDLQRR